MDDATKTAYKRGSIVLLPMLFVVVYAIRACVDAEADERRRHPFVDNPVAPQIDPNLLRQLAEEERGTKAHTQRPPRPSAKSANSPMPPLVAGRSLPDAIVADHDRVYWLDTGSGEVDSVSHAGGAVTVHAKGLHLAHPRHAQALALSKGALWVVVRDMHAETGGVARISLDAAPAGDADAGAQVDMVVSARDVSAVFSDGKYMYYAISPTPSRTDDGGLLGGVYRYDAQKKQTTELAAAEHPCALATDGTYLYFAEQLAVSRVPIVGGATTRVVTSDSKLACSLGVDEHHVYWITPSDDAVMRAKKDGSGMTALALEHTRPVALVVGTEAIYSITETSNQGLGELGSVWKTPKQSMGAIPMATEVSGLDGIATDGIDVFYTRYDEAEADGQIVAVPTANTASDAAP